MSRNSLEGIQSQLQRSILVGFCSPGIKTPFQLTTFDVMGASSDLFYVSMDIKHGRINLGKRRPLYLIQFPVVKEEFITVKVLPCKRTYWEKIIKLHVRHALNPFPSK